MRLIEPAGLGAVPNPDLEFDQTLGLVTPHRRSNSTRGAARFVVVRTSLTECSVCYGQVVEMRCPYLYRYLLAALIHARHLRTWRETLALTEQTCNARSAL